MTSDAPAMRPEFRRKILLSILLPVLVVGGALSTASVVYLTPPLTAFIQEHIDAQLKLASGLGMSICENHFNYLLELRLENNPEFNSALKIQAVEEIKAVSKQFNSVQLMVIEGQHRILGNSRALLEKAPDFPVLDRENRRIRPYLFWGHPVKTHIRYFPFWDWTVVSYVLDSDYLPTIRLARRVVYLGTFGVLGAVWCTLFVVIRRSISRPLKQLAAAAEDVAEGRFSEVPLNRRDEIGRVIDAFNAMVTQLSRQNEELTALITALRESERRYRDLFEGAVEGIIAANADSLQLTYANPAICRMLGYSEAELTQMRMPDIYPRGQAKTLETEFDTQMEREGQARFSGVSCIRRDGKIIQVDIKSTLITIDGTLHILGYFTDVTQQIKAMEEKGKLEARLHRAEKMEAIGTLAGGVAHDLNNILSGLVSYPELLLMDLPSDSPLRKPVLTIEQSGKRAAAIVQDLLTLARRGVAVSEVVNLNDIVAAYKSAHEFRALKSYHSKVRFSFDLSPDLMNIMGSPIHLSKTVMNLLSNAAEASPPEGAQITLTTRNQYVDRPIRGYDEVDEGDYAVISVVDNGIGIPAEDLPRIFEPFYTKKIMGRSGTGLGMAVVWGAVKDHNGYIDVSSEPGKGTTIRIYFPVTRNVRDTVQTAVSVDSLMGHGEHILVVDDIPDQREIASRLLTRLGYRVDTAASGEDAVAFIANTAVDLVVLDMIMDPGIDGLDTYRAILKVAPGQKAIITSGFSETERVRAAKKLGARQYVRKPYAIEAIGRAVKLELRGTTASAEDG